MKTLLIGSVLTALLSSSAYAKTFCKMSFGGESGYDVSFTIKTSKGDYTHGRKSVQISPFNIPCGDYVNVMWSAAGYSGDSFSLYVINDGFQRVYDGTIKRVAMGIFTEHCNCK